MKTVIPQTKPKPQKHAAKNTQPLWPAAPLKGTPKRPQRHNGEGQRKGPYREWPFKGSQTDRNTQKSNEDESDTFETIAPEKDDPVRKEFEIGQLGNQELKEDEITRDESRNGSAGIIKPSQRKF